MYTCLYVKLFALLQAENLYFLNEQVAEAAALANQNK